MKKLSLLLLVITIAASTSAQTINMDITSVKKIAMDEIVTSVKIYNNIEVILTNNDLNEIQIVGEKSDVENTLVKIDNGSLTITSTVKDLSTDRLVVYIPSKSLDRIFIHGSTTVSSTEVLNNEKINVTINGEGKSNIKTTGKVNVNTIGDFPLESSI